VFEATGAAAHRVFLSRQRQRLNWSVFGGSSHGNPEFNIMARQRGERYQLHDPVAEDIWQQMMRADQLILYSLLSDQSRAKEHAECFRGYPSLGSLEVRDAPSITAIYLAVRSGADDGTLGYRCWDPHHGIRIVRGNQVIDFVTWVLN